MAEWLCFQLFSLLLDTSSTRSIPFQQDVAEIFDDYSLKKLMRLF